MQDLYVYIYNMSVPRKLHHFFLFRRFKKKRRSIGTILVIDYVKKIICVKIVEIPSDKTTKNISSRSIFYPIFLLSPLSFFSPFPNQFVFQFMHVCKSHDPKKKGRKRKKCFKTFLSLFLFLFLVN